MSERPKRIGSERSPTGFPFGSRARNPGMKPTVTFGQRLFTETGPKTSGSTPLSMSSLRTPSPSPSSWISSVRSPSRAIHFTPE